uniref:Uncharacterized protein LOC105633159 n=1 Tax=Rhizophora mucronata TaxID=61149 RepID=A0A2P2K4K1_RHIMU
MYNPAYGAAGGGGSVGRGVTAPQPTPSQPPQINLNPFLVHGNFASYIAAGGGQPSPSQPQYFAPLGPDILQYGWNQGFTSQQQIPNYCNFFPQQRPDLPIRNANFPNQNPNLKQTPKVQSQIPNSVKKNPMLDKIDSEVEKAWRDLVAARESVSVWKVSQAVVKAMQVDSWSSLGFLIEEVPSLHQLIVIEGKVTLVWKRPIFYVSFFLYREGNNLHIEKFNLMS